MANFENFLVRIEHYFDQPYSSNSDRPFLQMLAKSLIKDFGLEMTLAYANVYAVGKLKFEIFNELIDIIDLNIKLQAHMAILCDEGSISTNTVLTSLALQPVPTKNGQYDQTSDEEIRAMMSSPLIYNGRIPSVYLPTILANFNSGKTTIFKISMAALAYYAGDKKHLLKYINDGYFGDHLVRNTTVQLVNSLTLDERYNKSNEDLYVAELLFEGHYVSKSNNDAHHIDLGEMIAIDIGTFGQVTKNIYSPLPWIK